MVCVIRGAANETSTVSGYGHLRHASMGVENQHIIMVKLSTQQCPVLVQYWVSDKFVVWFSRSREWVDDTPPPHVNETGFCVTVSCAIDCVHGTHVVSKQADNTAGCCLLVRLSSWCLFGLPTYTVKSWTAEVIWGTQSNIAIVPFWRLQLNHVKSSSV